MGRRYCTNSNAMSPSKFQSSSSSMMSRPWSLQYPFQRYPHDHPNEVVVSTTATVLTTSSSLSPLKENNKSWTPSVISDNDDVVVAVPVEASLRSLHLDSDDDVVIDGCHHNEHNNTESPTAFQQQQELDVPARTSTSTTTSSTKQHHKVRFGTCQVRSYTQVLGDHPFCSSGCPIQLGWNYVDEVTLSVELYEAEHHHHSSFSCGGDYNSLRLTPDERKRILCKEQQGVSSVSFVDGCDVDESGGFYSISSGGGGDCPYRSDWELTRACRRLNRGKHTLTRRSSRQAHREFFGV